MKSSSRPNQSVRRVLSRTSRDRRKNPPIRGNVQVCRVCACCTRIKARTAGGHVHCLYYRYKYWVQDEADTRLSAENSTASTMNTLSDTFCTKHDDVMYHIRTRESGVVTLVVLTLISCPFAIFRSFASVCDAPCWRQSSSVQTLNLADNGRSEQGNPSTGRPLLFGRVVGGLSCRDNVDSVIGSGTGEEEIMNAKAVVMAIAYYVQQRQQYSGVTTTVVV